MKKYIPHLMVVLALITSCGALDYKYDKKASESKTPSVDCSSTEYVIAGCEQEALDKAEEEAGE